MAGTEILYWRVKVNGKWSYIRATENNTRFYESDGSLFIYHVGVEEEIYFCDKCGYWSDYCKCKEEEE